ncbi:MAG: Arginine/ornithine antiporter ArcD [Chlorobi bacterium]|nr:Arginine/ornithine antiporter ArcD [Chlorobiota bacterium]
MGSDIQNVPGSKKLWAGRIISGIVILFFLLDAGMKVLKTAPSVEGTMQLGYPASIVVALGIVQLVCLVFYAVPRTSVLGAILLTGYLGGAVATHARMDAPLFSHTLFPIYFGLLIWGGLYLSDGRLRLLLATRR